MNQNEFTSVFCARPQNFAWFLGSGASRVAGLPTAADVLWDLKRRFYCREENQEILQQDIQNSAVRERIQSFMDSRGFPAEGESEEYPRYFEIIFGEDKERQRRYLKKLLSEDRVTLSVGNRVVGAMMASHLSRVVFTTNFDSVVERAFAEISGGSLAAYHLEGSHAATQALNNEEYPIYCKLHGDFRYDSLKNLPTDLATQNNALATTLANACSRFGLVVAGYSGRDASVMELLHSVLDSPNPYPHGLYWLVMKGSLVQPPVLALLEVARGRGVTAQLIEVETFDAILLRLWRSIEPKPPEADARVRKTRISAVSIPLPAVGNSNPILRTNALPVLDLPTHSLSLQFRRPLDPQEYRRRRDAVRPRLVGETSGRFRCWGSEEAIRQAFGADLTAIESTELPSDLSQPDAFQIRSLLAEALCHALARGKPLLSRTLRSGSFLIVNPSAAEKEHFASLLRTTRSISGDVSGLMTARTDDRPKPEQVRWAEAVRLSLDQKDGRTWLMIDPEVWIWPHHSRRDAGTFLKSRCADRFNQKYDALVSAWIGIILGTVEKNTEAIVRLFDGDSAAWNPSFRVASRCAYSRRYVS